jgi:hypothetical protein
VIIQFKPSRFYKDENGDFTLSIYIGLFALFILFFVIGIVGFLLSTGERIRMISPQMLLISIGALGMITVSACVIRTQAGNSVDINADRMMVVCDGNLTVTRVDNDHSRKIDRSVSGE